MENLEPTFITDESNRFTKEKELYQQLIEHIEFVSYYGKFYFLVKKNTCFVFTAIYLT